MDLHSPNLLSFAGACLAGALLLPPTAQTADRSAATPAVLELIASGPSEDAVVATAQFDHLPPHPAALPPAVAVVAEAYSFIARLEPADGQSPRLLRLGAHNAIEPGLIVLDDDGRQRDFEILTPHARLGKALRDAGGDLSAWYRGDQTPLAIDLPEGGWLLYGMNGRRVRPDRADGLRLDHLAGTARLGRPFRSPHVKEPGAALFGSEPTDAFGPSKAAGCEGLRIDPSRIYAVLMQGFPSRPGSDVPGTRRFALLEGDVASVDLSAEDHRTLPIALQQLDQPYSPQSPVKWDAELDGSPVEALVDALATGLRCVGTVDEIDRNGPSVILSTRPGGLIYRDHGEAGWSLQVGNGVGGLRLEDRGFRAAVDTLWATGAVGQDEAWARIDQRCPPDLGEARARRVALGDARGEFWLAEPVGDGRWNWTWSRKPRTGSGSDADAGTVDGAFIDALLAATDDEVSCQTDLVAISRHTHDRSRIPIVIGLDDGRTLTLESRSSLPGYLPWSVEIGDRRGIQESGAIGRALSALFEAAGTRRSAIHPR